MEAVWWAISIGLMVVGLVGAVFPVLPDSLLILAGALLQHFTIHSEHTVGWWTLGVLIALCVLAHIVDFFAGAFGAKKFGASRWGAFGGLVGGIVGTFVIPFPLGLFLGPLLGALGAEIIFAGRAMGPAVKSGWGTLLGTTVGMAGKIAIDLAMIALFFIAAFIHR